MQRIAGAAMLVVGALLVWLCRDLNGPNPDLKWGLALGVLLVVIGAIGLLSVGEQTTTVDARARTITVVDDSRFGTRTRRINFADVMDVSVQRVGNRDGGTPVYSLALRLRDGSRATLFPPGRFYPGSTDHGAVSAKRDRLANLIAAAVPTGVVASPGAGLG